MSDNNSDNITSDNTLADDYTGDAVC